jgi:RNA polymerase sigma factor (sigma-70 family)
MTNTGAGPILHLIRRVVEDQRLRELPDHDLLYQFSRGRDDAAFAALLRRHGPMVLDICRNMLGNADDAEDAFQATFLILAKRAGAIRKMSSVGSWLHGVAYRIALKAQARFARRQKHEARARGPARATAADDLTWREVRQVLHAELDRLSECYRAPVVLCYLEGKTLEEAALVLGVSRATVKKRLESARALLRGRLVQRGLGPAALLIAAAWPAARTAAGVPASLMSSTIRAASRLAAGTGVISVKVAALTEGGLRAMSMTRLRIAVVSAFLAAVAFGSAGVLAYRASAAGQTESAGSTSLREERSLGQPATGKKPESLEDPAARELKALEGEWAEVARTEGGYEVSADELKRHGPWRFKGATLHYVGDKPDCKVKIDPSKAPKRIELVVLRGPQGTLGKTQHGIYKLEKDRLTLCLRCIGDEGQPAEFSAEKGSHQTMVMLKRVTAGGSPAKEVPQENDTFEVRTAPDGPLSPELAARIGNLPVEIVKARKSDADTVDALYLAMLVRLPSAKERATATAHLRAATHRVEGVRDVAWALVNSQEFLKVHRLDNNIGEALKRLNSIFPRVEKK